MAHTNQLRATPEMRLPPYPDGGRHRPDDVVRTDATILLQNVDLPHHVAMRLEPAGCAGIVPPRRIVAPAAAWTILAAVGFVLEIGLLPAQPCAFVLQIRPDPSERSLVHSLVLHPALVIADPEPAQIAEDELSDSCLMQSLDPRRRQLVLDIPDLIVQLPELALLGLNQSSTALASFLFPINLRRQLRLQTLSISALGPEEPPVQEDMNALRTHDGGVDFPEIDRRNEALRRFERLGLIACPEFVLLAVPADLDLDGLGVNPIVDDHWSCAVGVWEHEPPIAHLDSLILPDDLVEPLAFPWRFEFRVDLPSLSPRPKRRHKALDRLLRGLGMETGRLSIGHEALERAFGEPDALAAHDSPEPDLRQRVDSPRLQREGVERLGLAEFECSDEIHGSDALLVLDVFLHGVKTDASDRRHEVAVRPDRRKTGLEPRRLLPEIVAGAALHPLHDTMDAKLRIAFDEDMNVVRHDLHLDDLRAHIVRDRLKDLFERPVDRRLEHRASVLRAPDDVVSAPMDHVPITVIAFHARDSVSGMPRNNQVRASSPCLKAGAFTRGSL